jgi:hypothetical protein
MPISTVDRAAFNSAAPVAAVTLPRTSSTSPLEPSHHDEPDLHHELRDALNAGLTNTDFFVSGMRALCQPTATPQGSRGRLATESDAAALGGTRVPAGTLAAS